MKYSKVISVGHSCNCKHFIRSHGLSQDSYPLDWMVVDIKSFIKCIENKYDGILDDYEVLNELNYKSLKILDRKYNFTSIHDIKHTEDFNVAFPEFKSKILRRVERWKEDIQNDSVCFIRMNNFLADNVEDVNRMYDILKSFNKNAHFHYLIVKKFDCDRIRNELNKGITIHTINFLEWHDIPTDESLLDYVRKYHTI